jgi:hypothetical protein
LNFLGIPGWKLSSGCFLPYIRSTGSVAEITPALTPVYTAMKMLSPVMILGSIPERTSRSIVSRVSCLSLFSNATNPKAMIEFSKTYRESSKYFFSYS